MNSISAATFAFTREGVFPAKVHVFVQKGKVQAKVDEDVSAPGEGAIVKVQSLGGKGHLLRSQHPLLGGLIEHGVPSAPTVLGGSTHRSQQASRVSAKSAWA